MPLYHNLSTTFLISFQTSLLILPEPLLVGCLVAGVQLATGVLLPVVPVGQDGLQERWLIPVPFRPAAQVEYLTFDTVAVPAQHRPDASRAVVVVKASDNRIQLHTTQETLALLGFNQPLPEGCNILYFKSQSLNSLLRCSRLGFAPNPSRAKAKAMTSARTRNAMKIPKKT